MFRFEKAQLVGLLEGGFSEQRTVRFQDVDAAGIVFYPRLFEYCHDAYVSFLRAGGHPLEQSLQEGTWAAPIRHAEADFIRPLRFGDVVDVTLVRAHLESTEMTLAFQLTSAQQVLACVQSVHTFVQAQSFQRIEIPNQLRQLLSRIPQA